MMLLIELTCELIIEVDNERLRCPVTGGEEREKTKKDCQRRTIKKAWTVISNKLKEITTDQLNYPLTLAE